MNFVKVFTSLMLLSFCCGAEQESPRPALVDNERVLIERIKQVAGWDKKGFVVRINEVPGDFLSRLEKDSFPERLPDEEQETFWKIVIRRYAEAYEKAQRQANDRNQPGPANFCKQIQDLFAKRLEMRGGGSVSWEMWMYLPGYVEWVLGHIESGKSQPMSNEELLKTWMGSHPFDLNPDSSTEKRLAEVITELRRIEAKLPPTQAQFLRSEFYRFFLKETPSPN